MGKQATVSMRQQQPGLLDISSSVHLQPRAAKNAPSQSRNTENRSARVSAVTPELLSTLGFSESTDNASPLQRQAIALRPEVGTVHQLPVVSQLPVSPGPAKLIRLPGSMLLALPLRAAQTILRTLLQHPAARHAAITRLRRKLRALPAIVMRRPQFDAPIHFTGAPLTTVLPKETPGTKNFVAAYEASRAAKLQAVASAKAMRTLVKVGPGQGLAGRTLRIPIPSVAFEKRVIRVNPHPLVRAFYGSVAATAALFLAAAGIYGYQKLEESNARGTAATQRADSAAKRATEAATRIAYLERQSVKLHRSLQSLEAEDARLRGIIAQGVATPTAPPLTIAQLPRPVREPANPQVDGAPRASAPNTIGKLAYIPALDPSSGGILTSSYGWRTSPWPEFHRGLDLAQPMGHSVLAAADGVVEEAGWSGGFGKLVDIDHGNGYHTYYGHLSRIDVTVGQHISRGEVIAGVGMTGQATGPHLHYQIMLHGTPIDPTPYMHGIPAGIRAEVR